MKWLYGVALVVLVFLVGAGCSSREEDSTPDFTPAAADSREAEIAPDFTLAAADGREVALTQLLQEHEAVVLVFYRGFF